MVSESTNSPFIALVIKDYNKMLEKGIIFVRTPKKESYGTVAVFEDLYGNMWDLLEPNKNNKGVIRD